MASKISQRVKTNLLSEKSGLKTYKKILNSLKNKKLTCIRNADPALVLFPEDDRELNSWEISLLDEFLTRKNISYAVIVTSSEEW